jgi:hypothetical protein
LKQWQRTYPNAPDAADFKQDSTLDQEYTIDPMWFEAPKEDPHAFNNDSSPQFPNHTWGDDPWDKHFPLVKEHGTVRFGPNDKEDSIQTWMKDGGYDKFRVGKFCSYLAPDMVPSTPPKTSMNKHSKRNQSAGNLPLPADPHSSLRGQEVARLRDAVHYREVFEHIGVQLDQLPNLLLVNQGLLDVAIGGPCFV